MRKVVHNVNAKRRIDPIIERFRSFKDMELADDIYYETLTPQERLDMMVELIAREYGA